MLSRPQGQILDVKYEKIAINRPFWFFSGINESVWELVICNMPNRFVKDTWKTFLSCPQVDVNADADDAELQLQ